MNGHSTSFVLPDLGEGLTEAEILRWLVEVGDVVSVDQPVVEVETAKAALELPCPYAGPVERLHGTPGEVIAVGAPLVTVAGAERETAQPETAPPKRGPQDSQPATAAPERGSVAAANSEQSDAVLVGYGSGTTASRTPSSRHAPAATSGPPTVANREPGGPTPVVSPLVRRMAREHGLDVAAVPGSGPEGLVLRRDVTEAIATRAANGRAGSTAGSPAGSTVPAPRGGDAEQQHGQPERIPLRGAQRSAAEQLTRSRQEIPEATVWVDAEATELLRLRHSLNEANPDRPVGLLALVSRFCVLGLGHFPELNATFDAERGEILRYRQVGLGFAAQTPRGLMVPVVPGAENMSARDLSAALAGLTTTARAGQLTPQQLSGATFTVNNYGVFGVDGSAAIIPYPQAAIVGIGRITRRPWVVSSEHGEELRPRDVVELTLAFDHRVCDGETAAGLLRFVADRIEKPELVVGEA